MQIEHTFFILSAGGKCAGVCLSPFTAEKRLKKFAKGAHVTIKKGSYRYLPITAHNIATSSKSKRDRREAKRGFVSYPYPRLLARGEFRL